MKTNNKLLLIVFFLFGSIAASAQVHPAMCRVFPLLKDDNVRSSYSGDIGSFKLDGLEGETIRSFKYDDRLIVTAAINFVFDYSKKKTFPYEIQLAVTASDREEKELFETPNSSEAGTLYKKGWNLAVSKNVKINDITYMFTVSCSDGLKLPRR